VLSVCAGPHAGSVLSGGIDEDVREERLKFVEGHLR
jgi:hypothetical protein